MERSLDQLPIRHAAQRPVASRCRGSNWDHTISHRATRGRSIRSPFEHRRTLCPGRRCASNGDAGELETQGLRGDLSVVGGEAMALAYNTRRSTRDLAAVFEPKGVIYEAARVVGDRHNLSQDWLNDGVRGFLPGEDPNATTLFDRPGLSVRVSSPRYLFAMKAVAARIERDAGDLLHLYRLCGFASVEEAFGCVEQHTLPI